MRIEDPPEGLACSAPAIHVKNIGDIEFARAHQFANIAIGAKILFIVIEAAALILIGRGQIGQLRFERRGPQKCLAMFAAEIREFHLEVLVLFLGFSQLTGQLVAFLSSLPQFGFPSIRCISKLSESHLGKIRCSAQTGELLLFIGKLRLETRYLHCLRCQR